MTVLKYAENGLPYYLNVLCEECNNIRCNAKYLQINFKNWTSGNNDIDKFIQGTQLLVHSDNEISKVLEWISYDRFYNIKYIAKGGFGKVYRANWIDGCVVNWDDDNYNWKRKDQNKFVALKSLNNSNNDSSEFMNQVLLFYYLMKILSISNFY